MTKGNVHQANEDWARINETAEHNPDIGALRKNVNAISVELAESEAFDLVDGKWILSDRVWTDWLFSENYKKYL